MPISALVDLKQEQIELQKTRFRGNTDLLMKLAPSPGSHAAEIH